MAPDSVFEVLKVGPVNTGQVLFLYVGSLRWDLSYGLEGTQGGLTDSANNVVDCSLVCYLRVSIYIQYHSILYSVLYTKTMYSSICN